MSESEDQPVHAAPYALPAGLIHDLRTPLGQIIGYSEMLIEQLQDEGQDGLLPDLQNVRAAGHHLLKLFNDNFESIRARSALDAVPTLLPEAVMSKDRDEAAVGPAGEIPDATPGFLLVVDDNEANRDLLSRRLEGQGYTVATADNGRRALELLREHSFDLLLLDITMPEMDGYEVLRRLKADDRLQHVPVIVISALNELESVARCIQMGAEDYLPKPFNPTLLRARIGACLDKKRAHDRETRLFEQLQQNFKRLQELEKLRDDLTHMIIHDLRTPLSSLLMGMHTLEATGRLNKLQREIVSMALRGGEALVSMISDLLDVDKMESGSMKLDYADLSVPALISSAVGQVASLAEAKQLALTAQVGADLPPLLGDESKLRRTLVNLLGNAIKFTPVGGAVTVVARACEVNQAIEICVRDTGEGIPREALSRIFDKFGQVETRQGGRVMSTGLGLTFCKLAIETHGGRIWVESAPGQGSVFFLTVPLSSAGGGTPGD